MDKHKLCIVIPAWNEEKRIKPTLEAFLEYFDNLAKAGVLDYELLVVINNTTDKTEDLVKSYQRKYKTLRYLNIKPGGKGNAIRVGFSDALKRNNTLIGFADADLSSPPEAIYDLARKIKNYGGTIGSRYLKGAKISKKQSLARIISSRIYNILIRALFLIPYRDTQCGAKVFKREAIQKALPKMKFSRWAFDLDLMYQILDSGYRIKEISTIWQDKGDETINFLQAGPWMALGVLRLRILNSIFKDFVRIYDRFLHRIYNKP